jgi:hypothetical protein
LEKGHCADWERAVLFQVCGRAEGE